MLTPQEVSEHAFSKASFGGYNMAMVDEFLDVLTEDYTVLYKENATLKAKMKVLVDKVEEYRSTEDAMRKALLTAQRMADDMVREAEEKKSALLKHAEADAAGQMVQLRQQIADEELRLKAAREETAAYVARLKELYQHEMDYLNGLSQLTAPSASASVSSAAQEIEQNVERLVAQEEEEEEEAAPQEAPAGAGSLYDELMELKDTRGDEAEEPTEPTRRIDFDHLQFGKDYEIK